MCKMGFRADNLNSGVKTNQINYIHYVTALCNA